MNITQSIKAWPTPKKIIVGVGVPLAIVGGGLLSACGSPDGGESEQLAVDLCHERVKSQAWVSETVRFTSTTEPEKVDDTWIIAGTVVFPSAAGDDYSNTFSCKVTAGSDSRALNEAEVVRY